MIGFSSRSPVRRSAIAVPLLAIALLELPAPASAAGSVALGRLFAQGNCSPCHAIGPRGASPHAESPPFRTLHERYDVEGLAEAFAEGIVVGHKGAHRMPEFMLTAAQIDNLIAYLKSLEPAKRTPAATR